jgi:5-methylcytosine-specific restriction endonuclease McrA
MDGETKQYNWWYWNDMRMMILERDQYCGYCHIELDKKTMTIDHMIPMSKGGEIHCPSNMVASCKKCNSDKEDMLPLDFICHRLQPPIEMLKTQYEFVR